MISAVARARLQLGLANANVIATRTKLGAMRLAERLATELVVKRECRKLDLLDQGLLEVWKLQFGVSDEDDLIGEDED